jgi:hypothetical protein
VKQLSSNDADFNTGSTDDLQDEAKTMPLGVGNFSDEQIALDPLASTGTGRKFNTGSLVIIVVIAVAIGGLWFMRTITRVRAASTGNAEVEMSIEKFLSAFKSGSSAADAAKPSVANNTGVLDVLTETYTQRQVPLTDVQRNPFIMFDEGVTAMGPAMDTSGDNKAKLRKDRETTFQRAADGLRVKSVIMGSEPLANISGKIVRKGDEVVSEKDQIAFRVVKVSGDGVVLVAEDPAFDLSIEFTLALKR